MSDQPVTPDREAPGLNVDKLYEVASEALRKWGDDQHDSDAVMAVDAVLPFLTDALDRARQQGRDELRAALTDAVEGMDDMIEYVPDYFRVKWGHDAFLARGRAALARGGPNRKDEE